MVGLGRPQALGCRQGGRLEWHKDMIVGFGSAAIVIFLIVIIFIHVVGFWFIGNGQRPLVVVQFDGYRLAQSRVIEQHSQTTSLTRLEKEVMLDAQSHQLFHSGKRKVDIGGTIQENEAVLRTSEGKIRLVAG